MNWNLPRFINEKNGWKSYPEAQYMSAKLCFFYSNAHSALPIRDYTDRKKTEPNYETRTYNYFDECNQCSVKSAIRDNISHLLFFTNYQGVKTEHRKDLVITGLFPISFFKDMDTHIAVASINPSFLSIEDALYIDNFLYRSWGSGELQRNRYGTINPRSIAKTIPHNADAMAIILDHFTVKKNRIEEYVAEIHESKKKNKRLISLSSVSL